MSIMFVVVRILSYTEVYSHPDKLLSTHLRNTAKYSEQIIRDLPINRNKYYADIAFTIGVCHDYGKSTTYFQDKLFKGDNSINARHGFISSILTYYLVKQVYGDRELACISFHTVLCHHTNLKNFTELSSYVEETYDEDYIINQVNNLREHKLWDSFYSQHPIIHDFLNNYYTVIDELISDLETFEYDNEYYLLHKLFYSVLLDADKMDASNTKKIPRPEINTGIIDEYKKNNLTCNTDSINIIREKAYKEVNEAIGDIDLMKDRILSINLPTGIGKTLTGFNGVLKLQKRIHDTYGYTPRIRYVLPHTSTIDQNHKIIFDILEHPDNSILLKHNYLTEMKYNYNNDEEYDERILIEGWNSEIVISTFNQLFESIIHGYNNKSRKFHNITNSIILIDEIQSIPYRYYNIINSTLKLLAEAYNCWIIIMTATQPLIFKEKEIKNLIKNKEYYYDKFNRFDFIFHHEKITIPELIKNYIENDINNSNDDLMIVCNTIKSSKKVYDNIKQIITSDINLTYLSTNITPYEREKRIQEIKDNTDNRRIIITTQLIEAGVDISVDKIYRDIAPLDSIIQTAGRCNRNNKKHGEVHIIKLINENNKPYYKNIYDSVLIQLTQEIIQDYTIVSEKEFTIPSTDKYYQETLNRTKQARLNDYLEYLKFQSMNKEFQLIDDNDKIPVFICINDEATIILEEYKKIKKHNGFEQKKLFDKIKNKFYNYTINIYENDFGSTNKLDDEVGVIYPSDLERKYNPVTGFIKKENESSYMEL